MSSRVERFVAFVEKTRHAVERRPAYAWLSIFLQVKGAVSLGAGSVAFLIGLWRDVNLFYAIIGSLAVVALVLVIMNQYAVRRGFKTTPSAGVDAQGAPTNAQNIPSHKQRATHDELAQGTITNRLVNVSEIPVGADGFIRQKAFIDCDIVGPSIFFPLRVDFIQMGFGIAAGTIESIIFPANPAAPAVVGVIGLDFVRFERGQFTNIGFTGPDELLNALRTQILGQTAPPPPGQ